jgi:peptidyl-prolyl cis-trans isomerase D
MSALSRIRENVGLVITVIAISLFSFIFVDLIRNFGGGPDDTVAEINGSSVPMSDLQEKMAVVERTSGPGETQDERDNVKIQAWQSLVREFIYQNEWSKAGITITDEELQMMFRGAIPHPYVQRSGYFNDSTGMYNPGTVDAVFAQADQIDLNDPNVPDDYKRWKQGLIDLRRLISLDRQGSKWQNMIRNAMLVSDNEINVSNAEQQRTANISYVFVPYASIADDKVNVSDADFNEYYGKNKAKYRRETEVQIKYTFFQVTPSASDSAMAKDNLSKIVGDFAAATKPFEFAFSNTDARSLDTNARPVGELPPAVLPFLGRMDTIVGPVRTDEGYAIYKVVKVQEDSSTVLSKTRHILLKADATMDSNAVASKASELRRKLQADTSTFASTAMAESKDMASSGAGGSLGWVNKTDFGPDFDKAVQNAAVGSVFTIKSPLGTHVVQVTDRSRKRYAVASIVRNILPSTETNEAVYKQASGYHGEVLGGADMDAALANYPLAQTRVSPVLTQDNYSLFGIVGARPVIVWAFGQEKGAISEKVLEADRAFVVARVEYAGKKGYKSVEDIKEQIRPEVVRYVKARQIKEKLSANTATDLNAIAAAYGPGAMVSAATDLRFSNNLIPNLGEEPKVVGRAFGLKQGEVSKALAGNNGVFVVKLDAIKEGAPMAPEMLSFQKMAARQTKSQSAINASFQGMLDAANIQDYRAKFEF